MTNDPKTDDKDTEHKNIDYKNIESAWEENRTKLLAYIHSQVNNHADAEDILHHTFFKLIRHQHQQTAPNNTLAWLYRTLKNGIIDYYRSHKQVVDITNSYVSGNFLDQVLSEGVLLGGTLLEGALLEDTLLESALSDKAFDKDSKKNSKDALASLSGCVSSMITLLPEPYKTTLYLSDIEQLKQQQVADRIHKSLSATKSEIRRARQLFKELTTTCCQLTRSADNTYITDVLPTDTSCCQKCDP